MSIAAPIVRYAAFLVTQKTGANCIEANGYNENVLCIFDSSSHNISN